MRGVERMTPRIVVSAAMIVGGVMLLTWVEVISALMPFLQELRHGFRRRYQG